MAPTFLTIPLEIRYQIYELLYREGPVCYPFYNSPITSIKPGGPPTTTLLVNHQLYREVLDHYYGLATFRFLALRHSQIARKDIPQDSLNAIRHIKKVEFVLLWNVTSSHARMGPVTGAFWMKEWLEEQVKLMLDEAKNLEAVIVSLRDASEGAGWESKKDLLEPLQALRGKVRFVVGEIIAGEDVESEVKSKLAEYLRELNKG